MSRFTASLPIAQLDAHSRLPDKSTILRFRHRLERHKLADQILATVNDLLSARGLLLRAGTAVDATLIPAPSSTKNKGKERDPETHSSQKGKQVRTRYCTINWPQYNAALNARGSLTV